MRREGKGGGRKNTEGERIRRGEMASGGGRRGKGVQVKEEGER